MDRVVKINNRDFLISLEGHMLLEAGEAPDSVKPFGDVVEKVGVKEYLVWAPCKMKGEPALSTEIIEAEGYEDLTRILNEALEQATSGKGKERHAGGKPFDKQPIMEIARMTGLAYQTGQAMKKIQESHTLLEIKGKEAAINELRGAIIYLAAAIKTIEEN